MNDNHLASTKQCTNCHKDKPISEFRRRTGKRSKSQSRRGTCQLCRKLKVAQKLTPQIPIVCSPPAEQRRYLPHVQGKGTKLNPEDPSVLVPSSKGLILMRGHSDKGLRWHQEIDCALAVTLVKEHAALVVNRRTISRIYSNKDFRAFILTRDGYICYFCGLYGDTIDHLLPRAKGGHTTPTNCVCACSLCNQTKADRYVEEFMGR